MVNTAIVLFIPQSKHPNTQYGLRNEKSKMPDQENFGQSSIYLVENLFCLTFALHIAK